MANGGNIDHPESNWFQENYPEPQEGLESCVDSILKYGDTTYDMLVVFQAQMLDAIDVLTKQSIPATIVGTTKETIQGLLGPTKADSIIMRLTENQRQMVWEAGIALKYAPHETFGQLCPKDEN